MYLRDKVWKNKQKQIIISLLHQPINLTITILLLIIIISNNFHYNHSINIISKSKRRIRKMQQRAETVHGIELKAVKVVFGASFGITPLYKQRPVCRVTVWEQIQQAYTNEESERCECVCVVDECGVMNGVFVSTGVCERGRWPV